MARIRSKNIVLSEYQECLVLWEWAQLKPILREFLIHHANERKCSKYFGNKLNKIGLRKGLPDYQFPVANKNWYGLWIEMKRKDQEKRKKNEHQIAWLKKLALKGHYATFAYGADEGMKIIEDYLKNKI